MPSTTQPSNMIIFEHPVNEQIRLYLRLEHLFQEFDSGMTLNKNDKKANLFTLLKIVNVVDRPDLKSKLVQLLTLHMVTLGNLKESPDIDKTRLHDILTKLKEHTQYLHQHSGKFGEELRQNEFLNQVRLHMSNPAGACETMLPAFQLWLNGDLEERLHDLKSWYKPFAELKKTIDLLLGLVRQSAQPQKVTAPSGFYQQNLDPNTPYELIQIILPLEFGLYPDCSANKHRLLIRFLKPDIYHGGRPLQSPSDIPFEIKFCRI
jgi:cell division protein ZapD